MPDTSRGPHRHIIGAPSPWLPGAAALFGSAWLLIVSVSASPAASPAANTAFQKYWAAHNTGEAGKAADDVVKSGVTFDEAAALLKAGRTYSAGVPRGIVRLSHKFAAGEFFYDLNVPANYDPAKRYTVRFQLHGGVGGRDDNQPRGDGSIGALAGAEQIYVIPYAWKAAPWWSDVQLANILGILDSVKRTYNVDENRVVLAGVSDGATATYYFAMRDTTPFASFLPLNGYIMVLMNPEIDPRRILFPNNIRNKPLFVVNGGEDPLYPTSVVEPTLDQLKENGVTIEYHPQPFAEHNTRWWPQVQDLFEAFVGSHPRDPHPVKVTLESSAAEPLNRAHWLVIDRVAGRHDDAPRDQPAYGLAYVVRSGNTVEAKTRDVTQFTLLLSPDAFDFSQPVKVTLNGRVAFEGRVEKSVATLMKWAARDNDRTMLYGAELPIKAAP